MKAISLKKRRRIIPDRGCDSKHRGASKELEVTGFYFADTDSN